MLFEIFIGLVGICWFLFDYFKYQKKVKGPLRFPILGNIPQIILTGQKHMHVALQKLSKKYGDLMLLKLGAHEFVVINTFKAAKELLKKEELNGRELFDEAKPRNFSKEIGIVFSCGERSNSIRKSCFSSLTEFGYGNRLETEEKIIHEAEEFVKYCSKIASENNGRVHMKGSINISVFNFIILMLTGKRRNLDDKDFLEFLDATDQLAKSTTFAGSLGIIFPFIKYFFDPLKKLKPHFDQHLKFVEGLLNSEKENVKYITYPRTFIEKLLLDIENSESKEESWQEAIVILIDIIEGGTESTGMTTLWIMIHLAFNPDLQERLHKEIDTALLNGVKCPSFESKNELNLVQATIFEGLRKHPIFPLSALRRAEGEFSYEGQRVDKGITVLTNIYAINNDEKLWKDPEVFRPERFIDKSTGKVIKDPPILTFGSGKKQCFGEYIAMDTLFIFVTTILKHFKLSIVKENPPSLDGRVGISNPPKPFDLIFNERNVSEI